MQHLRALCYILTITTYTEGKKIKCANETRAIGALKLDWQKKKFTK